MTRSCAILLFLLTAAAFLLRWPELGRRPIHNDEAVNAIKLGQLLEHGTYKYDPNEHHGPTLYYASAALGRLTGASSLAQYSEARLRVLPLLFGLGLLLLLPLVADGLGRHATVWAGLFTALSPALVYYSRDFIHESLLVFFTFLTLAAGWRYWRTRHLGWALLTGAGLGLMWATKETFIIAVGAGGLALGLNQVFNRVLDASKEPFRAPMLNPWHMATGVGACLIVAAVLFSSFFTNPPGLLDAFRTYSPWLNRAQGESPHIHPWYFYLERLLFFHADSGPVWSEAAIMVLAFVGAVAGFRRRWLGRANPSFVRFLGLYAFLATAFYSLIAYKTPWCLLTFWQATILVAGVGAAVSMRALRHRAWRVAINMVLLAACAHLAWQAQRTATTFSADQRNPYVYAQTSPDITNLVSQVERLAAVCPEGHRMLIQVMAPDSDYWPLPWSFRKFEHVGWWAKIPEDPFAPVMLVSARFHANLDQDKSHLMVHYYKLRPDLFLELYVEAGLWRAYLEQRNTVK